jgi:Lrp/AsnC family transcriptional regulator for asnA, asnC and gidA
MATLVDSLDREIIATLQQDGRTSNAEMARQLGVAEGTVRRRIERLINEGIMKVAAVVDPFKVGMGVVVIVHLDVELQHLEAVAEKLAEMPSVRVVAYITGGHDILVEAIFPSQQELLEFVKDDLPVIPGIKSTETSIVLQLLKRSYEWEIPKNDQPEQ